MALTRPNVEALIVARCSGFMQAAGLPVTVVGTNAALDDPIGWALRQLAFTPADPVAPTTSDLAGIDPADYNEFLDLVELRTLETCAQNYTAVDLRAGMRSESFNQLAQRLKDRIDAKKDAIAEAYGSSLAELSVGVIRYDFQASDEDEDDE